MKKLALIVDDDELVIRLYKQLFNRRGYETSGASTGASAKQLLKHDTFDIVILDIKLPDSDGFEILEMIRNDEKLKHIKTIMFSGFADNPEIKEKCRKYNVQCVTKGTEEPAKLVEKIIQAVDKK